MITRHAAGRPSLEADIDFATDPDLQLYQDFYNAMKGLSYGEKRALARGMHVCYNTIVNWSKLNSFPPRRGTAVLVIQWVRNGKPMRKVYQSNSPVGFL